MIVIRRSIQTTYNKRKILKDFNTRAFDACELIEQSKKLVKQKKIR